MWPNRKLLDLLNIDLPVIQAPMAGANDAEMVVAVSEAGGLGSLPCGMLDSTQAQNQIGAIQQRTDKPFGVNFLCHSTPAPDADRDAAWREVLAQYYAEFDLEFSDATPGGGRAPFDEAMCAVVEKYSPTVVSFHFGLPAQSLLERVKASGSVVMSSATTVAEARWLEANGCDVIIAQGYEAGGHRGMFLTDDIDTQLGTFALVPQVVDVVDIPVIAAGGIADGRGVAAAFALGAAGVQIGTAYLHTQEALISDMHRTALTEAAAEATALTNLFSGRPARGLMNRLMREIGPLSQAAPAFPNAGSALAPLKARAEQAGSADFSSLWAGQAASLDHRLNSFDLTRKLASDAQNCMQALGSDSGTA